LSKVCPLNLAFPIARHYDGGMDSAVLEKEALKLSAMEKAQIIDALWQSLDSADQAAIDKAWLDESKDRLRACREGKLAAHDGEETLHSIETELDR
jgi:putative addiction module component (TIGR02574 family)